jgi:hypothetical protein
MRGLNNTPVYVGLRLMVTGTSKQGERFSVGVLCKVSGAVCLGVLSEYQLEEAAD